MIKSMLVAFLSLIVLSGQNSCNSDKYYLIFSINSDFDSQLKKIDTKVSYCAMLSNETNLDFNGVVKTLEGNGLVGLKRTASIVNVFFPIHDFSAGDFSSIDTSYYLKSPLNVDTNTISKKTSMWRHLLYGKINDFSTCNYTGKEAYLVIECKGKIQYLSGEILKNHLYYNNLFLQKIKNEVNGDIRYNATDYDSSGNMLRAHYTTYKCNFNFDSINNNLKAFIDFEGKSIKDSLIYRKESDRN